MDSGCERQLTELPQRDIGGGEIAALFDTVYVSFYKGIGALPGCCVAGPDEIVAEVREWRHRMGGGLFGLWPNAASPADVAAIMAAFTTG